MPIRRGRSYANEAEYVFEPGTQESELDRSNLDMMNAWQNRYASANGQQNLADREISVLRERERIEKENAARMAASGLNPDGSPIRPEWQSLLDPEGKLKSQYQLSVEKLDPTQIQGYQKYKTEAMRTGPSAWANMQLQGQAQAAQAQRAAAAQQAMTGSNQAMSQLAMRGGLGAGARTSLAKQSARDLMAARQGVSRQEGINRLNLLSSDEQNRIQQLGNLASSETDIGKYNTTLAAQEKEKNLSNLLREVEGKRGFDMGTYQEQMKKWAAGKQADATSNSGGGGGK